MKPDPNCASSATHSSWSPGLPPPPPRRCWWPWCPGRTPAWCCRVRSWSAPRRSWCRWPAWFPLPLSPTWPWCESPPPSPPPGRHKTTSLVSSDTEATDSIPSPTGRVCWHRVVVLLLQLPLLLLLPLGLHLHGLGDQVSEDGDRLGLADERVLNIDKERDWGNMSPSVAGGCMKLWSGCLSLLRPEAAAWPSPSAPDSWPDTSWQSLWTHQTKVLASWMWAGGWWGS